jgi:hypothetical protein
MTSADLSYKKRIFIKNVRVCPKNGPTRPENVRKRPENVFSGRIGHFLDIFDDKFRTFIEEDSEVKFDAI